MSVRREIVGKSDSHLFDVVLMNGQPSSALVTPNLSDPRLAEVRRDLEAAAWSIYDVAQYDASIRFAIVRDRGARPAVLKRIDGLLTKLPIEALERADVPGWVTEQVADDHPQLG